MDLLGGTWRVKVKEKLGLLGPGPGWKLSDVGGADVLCPCSGAGPASGAGPYLGWAPFSCSMKFSCDKSKELFVFVTLKIKMNIVDYGKYMRFTLKPSSRNTYELYDYLGWFGMLKTMCI